MSTEGILAVNGIDVCSDRIGHSDQRYAAVRTCRFYRRLVQCLVVAFTMSSLSACSEKASRRYTILVEVSTPRGIVRGLATREVRYSRPRWPNISLTETRPHYQLEGAAVAIHLPNRQRMYALLSGKDDFLGYGTYIAGVIIPGFWVSNGSTPWRSINLCNQASTKNIALLPKLIIVPPAEEAEGVSIVDSCAKKSGLPSGYKVAAIKIRREPESTPLSAPDIPAFLVDGTEQHKGWKRLNYLDPRRIIVKEFKEVRR